MYSKEEAIQASIEYFDGDELAADVFVKKYALTDKEGNLLEKTPDQMFRRIAKEFARIEKNKFKKPMSEDEIFEYLDHFKYIVPAGSPMFGIGNINQIVSLSNCYLCSVPYDAYSSILKVDEQIVNICKRRGGVGVCIDKLRPNGIRTNNAAKTSTGIIPFLERYSNSIREVGQENRRGAGICILSVHHPQILDFVNIKRDLTKVTGMNISVKLTDEFLKAVENDTEYEQRWPVDETPKMSQMVKAREVWNQIIDSAWTMGEPGLLIWDNITKNTPADCYEEYASKGCNPCSELNLSELDSCRLMSMNLFSYVDNPFTKKAKFNFDKLDKHVQVAERLMDDLVDLESEKINLIIKKIKTDPEPMEVKKDELQLWKNIKQHNDEGRRTGLGMTAIADVIAAIGLQYGSDESIKLVSNISKQLKLSAYRSSVDMAKELGFFNCYDSKKEVGHPFIERIKQEDEQLYNDMVKYGRRNIALTTIAPTGSISIETQTSSGIEPLFMLSYMRRRKLNSDDEKVDFIDQNGDKWQEYEVIHPKLKLWMEVTGETDITKSPWYGSLANDIPWKKRVELQGKTNKNICHSISSTINLSKDTPKETVAQIYETAWKQGCKGITVYRDGSRTGVLVNKSNQDIQQNAKKRPKEVECEIYHTQVTKKLDKVRTFKYMVMIGVVDGEAYEIFATENSQCKDIHGKIVKMKRGRYDLILDEDKVIENITGDTTETEDALTRMVSTSLRHGVPIHFIVEQLNKVRGDLLCYSKAIARSLKKYIKDGTVSTEDCDECGAKLVYENGCFVCKSCGFSKCG